MNKNPVLKLGVAEYLELLQLSFFREPKLIDRNLTIICSDEGTLITIDNKSQVISIDYETHKFIRFINSSPETLVQCINAYNQYGEQVIDRESEEEELKCVKYFESSIKGKTLKL